jgi:hypothetical protein
MGVFRGLFLHHRLVVLSVHYWWRWLSESDQRVTISFRDPLNRHFLINRDLSVAKPRIAHPNSTLPLPPLHVEIATSVPPSTTRLSFPKSYGRETPSD